MSGITRPKLSQVNTAVVAFRDPITVIHAGATSADVDIGFLMNRANGLLANVAIYWNESGNTFVTAFTSNSGATDSNIVPNSYANFTTGNIYARKLYTNDGLYWASNGNVISTGGGGSLTSSNTAPANPSLGDFWYKISVDILYQYINDGTTSYWVDVQTSVIAANASTAITDGINANLGAYQTYANANVASIQANLGAYQTYANANVASIQANIGAFYTYANTKIGTNTNGNLIVTATTTSTSTTTGALVVAGGAGVAGNINIGGNTSITSNLTVTQSGLFRGPYDENSTISGLFVGNTGVGVPSPRVGFFNGNTQQNWQIDNFGGAFRWFVPGATRLSLYPNGNLNVVGSLTLSGKQAVNGPAFSAYANASPQTITTGSQQKVLFGAEDFDTNNNYANSRFTPTVEGYYQLNAEVRLDGASGTGEMMIVLYKNGAEHKRGWNQSGTQIASNFWAMTVSSLAYANGTGDYFEIYVQQGSGSSVTVTAVNNPAITWFNGCMIRGA